jgi:hypothetical protein
MMSYHDLELERKLEALDERVSYHLNWRVDYKILMNDLVKRVDALENRKVGNEELIELADSWESIAVRLLERDRVDSIAQGNVYRNCAIQLLATIREVK